ncbi:metallophosphoesterase [Thalassoglobus polymorphus]|uniref:Calcineurin-like phosphoesterase superfamily domain protein n=1 Tax=Thalassoglobus polymorphus TaxID=2527994 RepID=A0A517QH06_9PLAN|nr:metallophosphoesterase [Thalassoglobus polymorphus]QDT30926.1 Calcineurin-like phosphoesterase superfamily domain protein [Thalassoglobus polymorphus]QDT30971.1 Calcineurin-like phosphoesterase superfamily domain protein [Thalassoglobus polymorphus]
MARVLIIGDTHCPGMLPGYPKFLESIYKQWSCDTVVHIGDLVDWHAINFHGKQPETHSVDQEVKEARKQVAQLGRLFPEAHWLTGNHDALPARRAEAAGLPSDILRGDTDYWNLPGWQVYPRYDSLTLDGVLYSHGETGSQGRYAATNQAKENTCSTVIGHLHGNAGVNFLANRARRMFGLSVGCGVDWRQLQFEYGRKFARKPLIGCGVVLDGSYAYWEPANLT